MARLISTIVSVYLPYVLVTGSKYTGKMVQTPSTPQLCRELCQAWANSTDSYNFLNADLSCFKHSANVPMGKENPEPGDQSNDETENDNTPSTATLDQDTCNAEMKGDDSRLSKLTDKTSINRALHQACKQGKLCEVKYLLLNKTADINYPGRWGNTPVITAVTSGQFEVFEYLLSQGCDLAIVNSHKDSVLIWACIGGNTDIVKRLIVDEKMNIDERRRSGATPVMTAAFIGNREVFDLLVRKGCNLKLKDNKGRDIFHIAVRGGHAVMVNYILSKYMFDIDSSKKDGLTAVLTAASKGHINIVKLLVRKGCNLKTVDALGNNVLHYACYNGNVDMVKYLLSFHIFTGKEKNRYGQTPMNHAETEGHKEIVALFNKRV